MNDSVCAAVEELRQQYPRNEFHVADDVDGGAFVIIEDLPLGPPFEQATTWVGFHIVHACPYADTYPHFVRPDLRRVDGAILTIPFHSGRVFPQAEAKLRQPAALPQRAALMVSRRSNKRDPSGIDTPRRKLAKVMQWMSST